jgi:hypothetical protein
MGVQFSRVKIVTNDDGAKQYQVYSSDEVKPLSPITGITRIIPEGHAQKISQAILTTSNGVSNYNTIWQPLGQEGWTIKIQTGLRYNNITGYDAIAPWLSINASELIYVVSNCCNSLGEEDTIGHLPYEDLPLGTLWYIDHILISSVDGTPEKVQMELTLIRCWEEMTL